MLSAQSSRVGEVVTISAPVAQLTSELLHAMGQPLTILQTCRLLTGAPQVDAERAMDLLPEMAEQVERITELYRGVRSLFEVEADAMRCERQSLKALVDRLEPEWRRRASRRDVLLSLELGGDEGPWIHAGRGEEVLARVFDAVLASVSVRGRMQISWICEGGNRGLAVEGGSLGDLTAAAGGLNLRIAEALLRAEGGHLVCENEPMRVRLELPPT